MSKNRLADSLSPYLRQHADNPVHWQPWDADSLAQAQQEDKPILLSVGYAACHWCHVMAHESFEDPQTAAVMNQHFVNIKVDREERPDLDRIYQAAHYIFSQRAGGWPLTMFLTPTGEPFYGGTYFPRQAGRGLPAFITIMEKVIEAWHDKRDDINAQNAQVIPALQALDSHPQSATEMCMTPVEDALRLLGGAIDKEEGGFRGAPKFPHPVEMALCMHAGMQQPEIAESVRASLHKMATGGLCDHVGGGFFRYCVDAMWAIPHFEKMLYDNGLLLAVFADATRAYAAKSNDADSEVAREIGEDFKIAAEGIGEWLLSEMQHSDGGFYSSLDADSVGGEGAFYVWTDKEVQALLSAEEYAVFSAHYGLAAGANFEGKHHLGRRQRVVQTAQALAISPQQCQQLLNASRQKLQVVRSKRERPATDDKILSAWNGLMIRGLARGGRLLGKPQWLTAARTALDFVANEMMHEKRLYAVWRDGQRGTLAFLDDCAFMLDASLELLRAQVCPQVLSFAITMAEQLRDYFEDERGGFYFSANDSEQLIRRPKPVDDNAIPSGNGVAVRALMQLSWLTGDMQWANMAEKALKTLYGAMAAQPAGCASLLSALRWHLSPPQLLFLSGNQQTCKEWQVQIESTYCPDVLVYIVPAQMESLPQALQKPPPSSSTNSHSAYIYSCHGMTCRAPVDSLSAVEGLLKKQ